MENQILQELKEPKAAIVQLDGTSNLPKAEQLSATALDKQQRRFRNKKK